MLILSVDPVGLENVRKYLFAEITFTNANAKTAMPLAGNEGLALSGLEPVAVYEILMRALAVNFTESFSAILSRLVPQAAGDSLQPSMPM